MSLSGHWRHDVPALEALEPRLLLSMTDLAVSPLPPLLMEAPSPVVLDGGAPEGAPSGNGADIAPPRIVGVELNGRPGRSVSSIEPSGIGVRSIEVAFSEPVTFAEGSVVLRAVAFPGGVETPGAELPVAGVSGSGTDTMTISFDAAAVVDTWVKVQLKAVAVADLAGNLLDGEAPDAGSGRGYLYAASGDLPTGDATPGGDAIFYVGSLRGDLGGGAGGAPDGRITEVDVDLFMAAYQSGDADADFRGVGFGDARPDGQVTGTDIDGFISAYQAAVAADRHLDPLPVQAPGRPAEVDEDYCVSQDQVLTVSAPGVLGNDTDPDGDPLTALPVGGVSHGTLALNADGSFTYTPAAGFCGSDAFTYKASDGSQRSSIATVTLTVGYFPGATVVTYTVSVEGGVGFVVVGTDGAETITLSQSGSDLVLTTSGAPTTFPGPFNSIWIYCFAGDDTIRLTHAVTPGARVYAGDGNDTVYDAGTGSDVVYGGAGDDLLVTVGSGADTVYGGSGLDSLWVDGTDAIADASADETAAGTVHAITEFYQPSTDPSKYVSLEMAGQDIIDPTPTKSYAYADFSSRPLFVDGPEYNDIRQGDLGDCYFLASLASLADTDPGILRQMIAPLGDGTFGVRFYSGTQAVYLRVDGWLPASGGSPAYAKLTPENELWVALTEKAYAQFRGSNKYSNLNGGWMEGVYRAVTGVGTDVFYTSDQGLAQTLADYLAAGHALSALTWWSVSGPVYPSHVYMVKAVETVGGTTYITIYNPWGFDGKPWDSNPNDGLLRITLEEFQLDFWMGAISLA